ncbi:ABC transporter permease [Candidatus Woesearchaeota archaeon]|nr:ABC transporter permease [Candidatus Woesearchaeota archaeon]
MLTDYFLIALNSIRHRKLRSWLTVIGIVIGVAAIISLITASRSLESTISQRFEQFGANRILISAKGFHGPGTLSQGLTQEDVKTIETIPGFKYVTPGLFRTAEIKHNKEIGFTLVGGLPAEDFEIFLKDTGVEIKKGRAIKDNEKNVAIIGSRASEDMFPKELKIGDKIEINKFEFKIIGIVKEIGNQQDDNQISIPLESARKVFDEQNRVDTIIAQVKSARDIHLLQKRIEKELEKKRGDTNFQVLTASQVLDQINQVLGIIQIFLVGIAAISLIVGAIGIMNSMYTSVLERTKDIGIMKAIGARNSDILQIFIIESGLIGLVGGSFGIILGSAMALIIGLISKSAGVLLTIKIEPLVLLFGLVFAFVIGVISGILPAMQASKLKPVDALRYE